MDTVSKAIRSRMMAAIRGKDTKPEMLLRRGLFSLGYRYRLHVRALPGRPDLVMPGRRIAVFVHGCFWHQHPGCKYAARPKSNVEFWQSKLAENRSRDQVAVHELLKSGWRVLVLWECALGGITDSVKAVRSAVRWIEGADSFREIPKSPPKLLSARKPGNLAAARLPGRSKRGRE